MPQVISGGGRGRGERNQTPGAGATSLVAGGPELWEEGGWEALASSDTFPFGLLPPVWGGAGFIS